MGSKLKNLDKNWVPGPGAYNSGNNLYSIKSMKFGSGSRSSLETGNPKFPGPADHSPEYHKLKS